VKDGPYIRWINPDEATGDLADQYEAAVRRAGRVFHVVRIHSLKPSYLRRWVTLYIELMMSPSDLPRPHREAIATVVSAANGCFY
jgi:alkylhydroperoxidase family enzyme